MLESGKVSPEVMKMARAQDQQDERTKLYDSSRYDSKERASEDSFNTITESTTASILTNTIEGENSKNGSRRDSEEGLTNLEKRERADERRRSKELQEEAR